MNSNEQTLKKLRKLNTAFNEGEIPVLHKHEVNPGLGKGSRENYLYFTMTCALNFQRVSPNTWKAALETWNDKKTNFVFFPEKVAKTDTEKLREALLKHKLALQPNKHIDIWQRISRTLNIYFENDVRKIFEKGDFDAQKVLEIVQKEMKKDFPYLSGPKLSNYFIFILLHYSDLEIKNKHFISIIPDTHIMQSTEKLGILPREKINPKNTEDAWRSLLKDTEFSPIDFHSLLWNWSRNNFKPKV